MTSGYDPPPPGCFCDFLSEKARGGSRSKGYDVDVDVYAEMNAMSSQERARMEEEIHGIADEVVEETENFLHSKLDRMRECLVNVPTAEREAWETAIFLRPALSRDDKLHLQWLRAARYDCYKAASLMLAYFRDKNKWFGSDLIVRRITWDDVS